MRRPPSWVEKVRPRRTASFASVLAEHQFDGVLQLLGGERLLDEEAARHAVAAERALRGLAADIDHRKLRILLAGEPGHVETGGALTEIHIDDQRVQVSWPAEAFVGREVR